MSEAIQVQRGLVALRHDDHQQRLQGIALLAEVRAAAPVVVAALGRALRDPYAEVRHAACWALGDLRTPLAAPVLLALLTDKRLSAKFMVPVAYALGQTRAPEALWPLLTLAAQHRAPMVQDAALRGVLRYEAKALEVLQTTVRNAEAAPMLRATAARALGALGLPEAAPVLRVVLQDVQQNSPLAWELVRALGELSDVDAAALLARRLLNAAQPFAILAAWALARLASQDAVRAANTWAALHEVDLALPPERPAF